MGNSTQRYTFLQMSHPDVHTGREFYECVIRDRRGRIGLQEVSGSGTKKGAGKVERLLTRMVNLRRVSLRTMPKDMEAWRLDALRIKERPYHTIPEGLLSDQVKLPDLIEYEGNNYFRYLCYLVRWRVRREGKDQNIFLLCAPFVGILRDVVDAEVKKLTEAKKLAEAKESKSAEGLSFHIPNLRKFCDSYEESGNYDGLRVDRVRSETLESTINLSTIILLGKDVPTTTEYARLSEISIPKAVRIVDSSREDDREAFRLTVISGGFERFVLTHQRQLASLSLVLRALDGFTKASFSHPGLASKSVQEASKSVQEEEEIEE